jgi:hypothetical protein
MDRIKKRQTIFIIIFVVGLFIPRSIYEIYDKYGQKYDDTRKELGILEIPDDWKQNSKGTKTKLWYPPNHEELNKGRRGKEVLVNDDNKIYLERDRIIFQDSNIDIEKCLEIVYDYKKKNFEYEYFEIRGDNVISSKIIEEAEFRRYLNDWEIEL